MMYEKLVLENNSGPFSITFNGIDHNVPTGKFEAENTLGEFILSIAKKWKKDIVKVSHPEAPKVTVIKDDEFIEPVKEAKEEVKETVEVKPTKKKK